jgi:hypothetical protein
MKLNINKQIEVGDLVYYTDDDNKTPMLVCKISEQKYGLYLTDKYDGLAYYWKDDCALHSKAIYVEVK